MSPTPRTTALFEKQDTATDCTNQDRWEEMAVHAHELETELARLRTEVKRWQDEAAEMSTQRSHNANQAGRLRAEVCEARKAWLGDDYGHLPLIKALEKFRSDSDAELDRAERNMMESAVHAAKSEARAERAENEIERWRDSNNRLRAEMELQAQRAERAEAAMLKP